MIKKDNMSKIEKLIEKGVKINRPASVEIGDEIDIDRISADGVVIYSGCKIFGADTLILPGAKLGYEAPVTVDNCQVGPEVELKGGFCKESVFLQKSSAGSGARGRSRPSPRSRTRDSFRNIALCDSWPIAFNGLRRS